MRKAISPLCFGCEPLGGADWGDVSVPEVEAAIGRALELGVDFFDTAAVYGLGLSEERLAKALGTKRHDVVIATKGGLGWSLPSAGGRAEVVRDGSSDSISRGLEDSLLRLRIEQIPIYYVHWPDENTPFQETFETLAQCKQRGLIGSIGCSNFTLSQIEIAKNYADIEFLQVPMNIMQHEGVIEITEFCYRHNISIVAYNVLANGLLTGKYSSESIFSRNDRRSRLPIFTGSEFQTALKRIEVLKQESSAADLSLTQYAIQWVMRQKSVVSAITGIKSVKQLEENYSAVRQFVRINEGKNDEK